MILFADDYTNGNLNGTVAEQFKKMLTKTNYEFLKKEYYFATKLVYENREGGKMLTQNSWVTYR